MFSTTELIFLILISLYILKIAVCYGIYEFKHNNKFGGISVILFAFFILSLASSNETNIVSVFLAKNFTAFPGNALLSCNIVGIFKECATVIVAPQIYPPVPITISGFISFNIF